MRVFIMVTPQFPIPPEQFPALLEGFAAWRERYRGQMEAFEFFAGGGGGFGIVNVADERALTQMVLEYPFTIYSTMDVRPILDGDTALQLWREGMKQMMTGHRQTTVGPVPAVTGFHPDPRQTGQGST